MSKFSEQQEVRQEVKEKDRFAKQTLAKTVHNLGLITFTGLVIGAFTPLIQGASFSNMTILIGVVGIAVSAALIALGYRISRM